VFPVASLSALRAAYETAAGWARPARVVAVALHTGGLDDSAARAAIAAATAELDVPATDPVRFGAAPLAAAVLAVTGRTHAPQA
jgi:uncharacterized NAD-dependent epimerase/dehydratase family protein